MNTYLIRELNDDNEYIQLGVFTAKNEKDLFDTIDHLETPTQYEFTKLPNSRSFGVMMDMVYTPYPDSEDVNDIFNYEIGAQSVADNTECVFEHQNDLANLKWKTFKWDL